MNLPPFYGGNSLSTGFIMNEGNSVLIVGTCKRNSGGTTMNVKSRNRVIDEIDSFTLIEGPHPLSHLKE